MSAFAVPLAVACVTLTLSAGDDKAPDYPLVFSDRTEDFGIEPEITAKVFKRGYRVYEVPITYAGRGYEQGKKITWAAGFVALWVLLKYRFVE